MLDNIKFYVAKGLSAIAAAAVFIVMLPLAIGAMLMMLFAGMAAVATLRHRVRKAHSSGVLPENSVRPAKQNDDLQQRPPIEGSYTVIND